MKFTLLHREASYKSATSLGLILGVVICLRETYIAALPLMFVVATIGLDSIESAAIAAKYCAVSIVIAAALLMPLSIWVSNYTVGATLTVTSLELSQIISFGSHSYRAALIEEGGGGNRFFAIHRAVHDRSVLNDVSPAEQYRRELSRSLSLRSDQERYQSSVKTNIRYYLSKPSGFLQLIT